MPDIVSDNQLVEMLWQRQEQALLLVRQKYERPCRRLAASLLADPEDVSECLNDAYFTLWELVPPQRPPKPGRLPAAHRAQPGPQALGAGQRPKAQPGGAAILKRAGGFRPCPC